jgi:outer membrane protein OmpA-like peptidoglycan-associated protein
MKAVQRLLRHWMLGSACIGVLLLAQTAAGGFDNPLPIMTLKATRGLSQTNSAEAMGAGRLTFSLFGSWYQQANEYPLSPNSGANVYTGNAAFSFGVNPFIDVFASAYMFALQNYDSSHSVGIGTVLAGIQGTLPFADTLPVRLGAQLLILAGTSTNQINGNLADGYNYFETREGYDFAAKLLQTVLLGNESYAFKMHFNEGLVSSLQPGKGLMMLLAAGVQVNAHPVIALGVEINSRTFTDHISILTDPLWVTPTVCFRTPYYFNILLGGDVALSQAREASATVTALKALEPYRVFGAITFSFDLMAGQKAAARDKERQEALEKERLKTEADSLSKLRKREGEEKTRLMAQANRQTQAERLRADSLARIADSLARKSRADSIALAESKRQVEEERSKRSDAEKQLLSTGLLLLDAVYFSSGKTDVSINSKPYLNIIGKMLTKYPKLVLEVGGHTDNIGGLSANTRLSQARADAVRNYLITVAPELANHLSATGYGPSLPKADNVSADGRQMNRRVELKVLNKDVLKEYNP